MYCKYLFGIAAISGMVLVGLMASAFGDHASLRQRKVETHGDSLALIGGALLGIVLVRRQKFPAILTSQPRLLTLSGHNDAEESSTACFAGPMTTLETALRLGPGAVIGFR